LSPQFSVCKVLNGASGFGKTVMAEEFIQQFQSAYKNTFLINGSTAVTWHLSIISLCDYIGVNARRFQQCEREQLVLTEFSKSSPILILCDGLTEVCVGMLTDLVQKLKAAGNSVHMIITTRLHAIKTIDHYSVTMPKLTSTEVDSLFSMLGQWRGGSQPTDVAICGSTQLDILDGNPAACCLAKDYLAKTKSGIWALKPQYHGIWAELFFLYGKDKFSHWLEKNDIADLRVSLKLYGIHSVDDVLKAHPSFVDLPGKGKDKFLAAKRSLESELDGERLQVMVHLNLNAASRTANSIMNMLSVVGQTWLCFDILLEAWLKLYKEQTHQNAIKNLVLLETLGLVQLERHRDAIVAIRLPQSYQETVLHRLQTEKQTNYKKIVQCLAFVFSKRLTLGKAWDFQPDEVQLLPHAYEVARHCVTSSLFTVSARNLISFARELCFTLGLGTETRQLSEHLLKMEQLVSDNQFAVTREQIRVELAKQDIFNLSITDQIMVDILHTISDSLWKGGLKKLAVIVLECQASIISRCPEKLEQYPDIHVRLGEALLSIGQTQAAVESLTKAADASAVVGDTMKWKRTLNSQATAWEAAGEYAQSKMCYQKMLELVESNSEERLEILFRLGEVSNKAGHALDALGFFNHLLSKERETKLQKNMKLRAQEGMSLALKNNNDLQESLSAYQTLYTMAREEGEGEFQVNSLIGQADVYNAAHMFDSAVRMYQQALHLMEAKFRDHKDRAGCMNKLGNCHKNRRQFTLAKEVYEDCVSLCVHTGDRKSRAVALGNLGNIHQQMNDLKTALKYNMSQLELAKELNDEKMIVSANGSIGSCYSSLKNYSEALKYLHEAVEKAEKSKDLQELGRAYSNLGNVYQLSKQYSEAKRFFELSLDIVIRIGDTTGEARARGNLGNALQSLGEYKRAVQLYDVTIQLSSMPDVNDKMSEGNAYHNRGCALEGLNKLQPAKLSFEKAIAVFEQLFKQTGLSESFKPTYLQLTSKSFRRLQYVLAKLNMSREALEISERSRHRALVDIVKISKRQQKNTNSQSTDLQPEQITCDNILEMVRSQRAFVILYSICRNDMHIWTVDPTSGHLNFACKQVADDPRSESHLQKAIHSAIEDLTVYKNLHSLPEHQISDESCLESLYDWLVKPIEGWLPTRNPDLVIIPAGYIAHVPFGALKGPDGKYLSQKYRIRSVPSVMSLDADDIQDCSEANRALVVGNPLIPPVAVQGQVEPWKPVKLPHAQREAVDVAHLFNTTALTLKKATKRRVLDEMVDSDVIHIATHGNRGMTSLAFAPDVDVEVTSGQGVDPSLCLISCQDVEGLRLKAKLVVLSSCSSAWGPSTAEVHNPSGDGVMGLARAFLIAGSKSVIVTLWRVPDKATEHLMRFFYRNMQRGSPVTYSLQQAMHQVRCLEQFSHPQHWSSFQVVGSDVAIEFPPPFEVACVPDCAYFAGMEEALDTIAKWMRQDQSGLRLMVMMFDMGLGLFIGF
jgi:CHAT domain-containing protein